MATDVLMPAMGYDMTEGTIVRWLKQPGDAVKRGEPIAEIETDKAVVEIEAFAEGTLAEIVATEGEVVPVGALIARIGADGEVTAPALAAQAAAPTTATPSAAVPAQAATTEPPVQAGAQSPAAGAPEPPAPVVGASAPPARAAAPAAPAMAADPGANGRLRISPVAARIAAERGIDPHTIQGTGPDGRILRRDVENAPSGGGRPTPATAAAATQAAAAAIGTTPAVAAAPPVAAPVAAGPAATGLPTTLPSQDTIFEPVKMRQTMARRMAQSKGPAPHYYLTVDIEMTEAQALRKQVNESAKGEYKVSVNDLVSRAVVLALGKHPLFNATFTENGQIRLNSRVNLGLAVALPEGLIAPCVIDVGRASMIQLSQASRDLAERARANRLRPDEYADGTFTISNLGMYGIDTLVAIINPPQTAILGVGRVVEKPVARDGQVVIREMMTAALSADHRVTTGAEGAEFLRTIRETLENPVRLLV